MRWGLIILMLLGVSGCATTVQLDLWMPAKNDRAAQIKRLAVLPFENDRVGVARHLEGRLADLQAKGVNEFVLVALGESVTSVSGEIATGDWVQVGQLLGVQGVITGEVEWQSQQALPYFETRVQCLDSDCHRVIARSIPCQLLNAALRVRFRLIDTRQGDLVLSQSYSAQTHESGCFDEFEFISSPAATMAELMDEVVSEFIPEVAPYRERLRIELFDTPEPDYNEIQRQLLSSGLESIEAGQFQVAEETFTLLLNSTGERSYVAAYNLGVVLERLGQLERAASRYRLADRLTDGLIEMPDNRITEALARIERRLSNSTE